MRRAWFWLLVAFVASCATAPASTRGSARRLATYKDDAQLASLYQEHQRVLVLIGDGVFLFACARNRTVAGESEERRPGGAGEGRSGGGADESRAPAGAEEARKLGGAVEARKTGGADEGRKLGGSDEGRKLGGSDEGRKLGGALEGRKPGSEEETRKLGGAVEGRKSGATEESRTPGGQTEALSCTRDRDGRGFHVFGTRAPLRYFDGIRVHESINGWIED